MQQRLWGEAGRLAPPVTCLRRRRHCITQRQRARQQAAAGRRFVVAPQAAAFYPALTLLTSLNELIHLTPSLPPSLPPFPPMNEPVHTPTPVRRPSSVVRRMFECLFECSECMHVDIGHGAAHSADGLAALRQVVHVARGVPQDAAARDLLHGGHQLARRQVRRQQRARAVPGESVRRSVCSSASLRYHTKKSWVHYYPCVSFPLPFRRAFRFGISPATLTSRGSSRRAAAMTSSSRWRGAE